MRLFPDRVRLLATMICLAGPVAAGATNPAPDVDIMDALGNNCKPRDMTKIDQVRKQVKSNVTSFLVFYRSPHSRRHQQFEYFPSDPKYIAVVKKGIALCDPGEKETAG